MRAQLAALAGKLCREGPPDNGMRTRERSFFRLAICVIVASCSAANLSEHPQNKD